MSPDITVEHDVEYELVRLMRRSRIRSMQLVTQIHPDLDYASYLMLIAVSESTDETGVGVRGSDLADSIGVHKSTISRGLATLEKLHLVERVPDPTDGRARLVAVSEEAATRLASVRQQRHDNLVHALEDWDAPELAAFAGQLGRLNLALDNAGIA
ncbi:MarR family winged helix-turn-helix transcriptional regulator [Solicola sp. PLA-1-18]|uniref:MarR family winged helix-turn-helix transcriptional regulator n=1 Tax=Solicola sp. PLA-1-18 TaxID=3380532 RepID=UPI003B7A28C3